MEDFTFDEIHENFLGRSDAKHLNTLQTKLSFEQLNTQLIGPDENIFVLIRRQEPWLQSVSVCIVTIYVAAGAVNEFSRGFHNIWRRPLLGPTPC